MDRGGEAVMCCAVLCCAYLWICLCGVASAYLLLTIYFLQFMSVWLCGWAIGIWTRLVRCGAAMVVWLWL